MTGLTSGIVRQQQKAKMADSGDSSAAERNNSASETADERLKRIYSMVNEKETPLPRSWSPKDKYNFIGLSQNNLRVHYKGIGKNHKDAASVRATHPIPSSCGIYYFEVKIVSKGRDGYMGIGLSAQGVNMNRLPGWDKHSYGYHGDDGHSFCSSGTGQPYGPTFTTGDVVGCCVNLIDNTCFYTKNGHNLGIAFTDLPHNLYPTVGLQTPGEIVDANFGQQPFVYDIEDYMREWHQKTRVTIESFPVPDHKGEWQKTLQRMVSTYLVHHGYCSTAEAFAKSTGQSFTEELTSMKNRQRIQKLVLAGRMGEAIDTTQSLYPGLLERNPNLLFVLKCRQFVEMVNGTDSEVRGLSARSPKSRNSSGSSTGSEYRSSPSLSPSHHRMDTQRANGKIERTYVTGNKSPNTGELINTKSNPSTSANQDHASVAEMNAVNSVTNGFSSNQVDVEMEVEEYNSQMVCNGVSSRVNDGASTSYMNGCSHNSQHREDLMETDDFDTDKEVQSQRRQLCGGSQAAIEKMLQFGRELQGMSVQLRRQYGKNEANKKVLQDAFSLLAYADPWNSPVGYQLDTVQREPICAALNSAILESHGLPRQPPLEKAVGHATECLKLMSKVGIGSCAFANIEDYLR
ncbi:ran-binding protein 9-like isoform X1 [Branchiostoma floridae]|uniref:Ran-binding protein 9-like isoform X1 n=2 Tax=Branchiostoma floridae TaxID=7739 RepID=A0A9J7MSJ8_BRAFL|nr:ran-binding protein 9-like isoform X1 [Branchiostoma floridae]